MDVIDLVSLKLDEEWPQSRPEARMRNIFAIPPGVAAEAVVYFELDPGGEVPWHRDSKEEVILVLEGRIEFEVEGERREATKDHLLVVPANARHRVRNLGDGRARAVGFFPSGDVVSTFDEPLMPTGQRVFGAPG
ncbi:MAG TPA: cupin domain-containing protein [Candidatus Thermoplasmatota archaeon]|nr:cupin domain-containing protein [Candidatus Thermoplasmatota archaeon]